MCVRGNSCLCSVLGYPHSIHVVLFYFFKRWLFLKAKIKTGDVMHMHKNTVPASESLLSEQNWVLETGMEGAEKYVTTENAQEP